MKKSRVLNGFQKFLFPWSGKDPKFILKPSNQELMIFAKDACCHIVHSGTLNIYLFQISIFYKQRTLIETSQDFLNESIPLHF